MYRDATLAMLTAASAAGNMLFPNDAMHSVTLFDADFSAKGFVCLSVEVMDKSGGYIATLTESIDATQVGKCHNMAKQDP